MNTCSGCGACCEVVPVKELGLTGFTRCPHLRGSFHKEGIGCGIYASRPYSCSAWRCEWLKSDWEAEYRPDRCGLIVDENIDMIGINEARVPAMQIWVMPGHEDDWQTTDAAASLIMTGLDSVGAVLWRMRTRLAITFFRDPKTGQVGYSAPTPADPDADEKLGAVGKRMWEAEETLRRKTKRTRKTR